MPKGNNRKKYKSVNPVGTPAKIGIFNLKGVFGKNQIRIEHIENLDPLTKDQKLIDTLLEKYTIDETNFIYGKLFKCNITNFAITASKKQPMMYITVYMDKPLKTAVLFTLMLYFTLEVDNDVIKTQKQFLTFAHKGQFTVEILRDGESTVLDKQIDTYPGDKEIQESLISFTKTDDMIQVLKEIVQVEEEKIAARYKTNFDINEMPKVTVNLASVEDIDDYY